MNQASLVSKAAFDVRLLYVAASVIVALGYFFIFRGYEDGIALERANADAARAQTASYEAKIQRRGAIDSETHRLQRDLAGVELGADTSSTVARFLRDVAGTAARDHVAVVAVESESSASGLPVARINAAPLATPVPAATARPLDPAMRSGAAIAATGTASPAPAPQAFDEIPLQLTLHGSYQNLLACTRALSHMRVLARVDVVALSRLKLVHPGSSPDLGATVHVTLYHVTQTHPRPQGLGYAAARPT